MALSSCPQRWQGTKALLNTMIYGPPGANRAARGVVVSPRFTPLPYLKRISRPLRLPASLCFQGRLCLEAALSRILKDRRLPGGKLIVSNVFIYLHSILSGLCQGFLKSSIR